MKAITNTWNSFTELARARLWLFLVLVPIVYLTLPTTPNRHSFVIREFNKLAPSKVRAEVSPLEPEVDKLIRSCALCAVTITMLHTLESLRQSSFED